jgi:hypothetical protein
MHHLTGNIIFSGWPQKCLGRIRIWPNRNYLASLILIRNSGLRTRTRATFLGHVKWHSPHGSMPFHGAQKSLDFQGPTVYCLSHAAPVRNASVASKFITWPSGRGLDPGNHGSMPFRRAQKVSISRAQPSPICPRNGFACIINSTYGAV